MNNEDIAFQLYNVALPGTWEKISDLRKRAGLTWEQAGAAAQWWLENTDDVEVEPQPFGHRITAEERDNAPVIGGEQRHLIRFN